MKRMTNDELAGEEANMMDDQALNKRVSGASGFVLRHSFVIRHLSFVIALALAPMLLLGCAGKRITKANVDQIAENMSKKQVESILGPPTEIDTKDFLVMKKTTYTYRQGSEQVTIVFKDDKVQSKESTFSD